MLMLMLMLLLMLMLMLLLLLLLILLLARDTLFVEFGWFVLPEHAEDFAAGDRIMAYSSSRSGKMLLPGRRAQSPNRTFGGLLTATSNRCASGLAAPLWLRKTSQWNSSGVLAHHSGFSATPAAQGCLHRSSSNVASLKRWARASSTR